MRSVLIMTVAAIGLALVSTGPALSAPASCAVISQAAAGMSPVTQARCWCVWRGPWGRCRQVRCG
jgi:hypothetical protein